jgi:hypothetical protein
MRFPEATFGQPHIEARDILGDRQLARCDLMRPSAFLNTTMGQIEGMPERLDDAVVRRRRQIGIGIDRTSPRRGDPDVQKTLAYAQPEVSDWRTKSWQRAGCYRAIACYDGRL